MKKKAILAGAILLAGIVACIALLRHYYQSDPTQIVLYGNVDIRQVDLGFRVGGRIEEVLAEEGDEIKKGAPLARLKTDLLLAARNEARAQLDVQSANLDMLLKGYRTEEIAQARARLSSARASATNANANYERVLALSRQNAVSRKELDNATASRREAEAALKQASENLEMLSSGYREEEIRQQQARTAAARAALSRAEIQLEDAVLLAPETGVVLSRAREAGAIVNAGQTVYTLTLTNPVWLRAYVSEPSLGLVKPGMPVKIAVDAASGKLFDGQVGFISPTAEFTPKTVETQDVRTSLVYRIRVIAEDPDNVMRQGMPVTIFISKAS